MTRVESTAPHSEWKQETAQCLWKGSWWRQGDEGGRGPGAWVWRGSPCCFSLAGAGGWEVGRVTGSRRGWSDSPSLSLWPSSPPTQRTHLALAGPSVSYCLSLFVLPLGLSSPSHLPLPCTLTHWRRPGTCPHLAVVLSVLACKVGEER